MTACPVHFRGLFLAALLLPMWIATADAQRSGQELDEFDGVGIEQNLGEDVPLDLEFVNEYGDTVTLADYFDGERPVLLNLIYHECPMLCGLMLDGFTETLSELSWTPGDQFEVVTVSFNPAETPEVAQRQKRRYLQEYGREDAADGWHFLTGEESAIEQLAEAVGFGYKWIEEKQEYAHPAALMFLSGEGTISRYILGLSPSARDTRTALVEASDGKVGNLVDQAFLYCFQFDPSENAYVANAFNLMRLGALFTIVILGFVLFNFWRRENRRLEKNEREGWSDADFGDEPALAS